MADPRLTRVCVYVCERRSSRRVLVYAARSHRASNVIPTADIAANYALTLHVGSRTGKLDESATTVAIIIPLTTPTHLRAEHFYRLSASVVRLPLPRRPRATTRTIACPSREPFRRRFPIINHLYRGNPEKNTPRENVRPAASAGGISRSRLYSHKSRREVGSLPCRDARSFENSNHAHVDNRSLRCNRCRTVPYRMADSRYR